MKLSSILEKLIPTSLLAVLSFVYQTFGILFYILIIFMLLDYLSGVGAAIVNKTVSSKVGINGIIKKIGYVFLLVCCSLFDMVLDNVGKSIGFNYQFGNIFAILVNCWLICNEFISIIENLKSIGVPAPLFLISAISKFKLLIDEWGNK